MKILHLYYDSMNLYGDYANVDILKKHLEDQGISVTVDRKSIAANIDFNGYDFIYIGSGSESSKNYAVKNLSLAKDNFKEAIEDEKIVLLTGNAMELVSKENLDILDVSVEETDRRYTGDIIVKNNEVGELVGFINKCSIINNDKESSLFEIEYIDDNLDAITHEGYRYKNLFGTHLIGPLLVKNPNMMEYIIKLIMKNIGYDEEYKNIDYKYENESYKIAINELKNRNNHKKGKK